jgi:hypothetical protein
MIADCPAQIPITNVFRSSTDIGIIRILVISYRRYILHCSANNREITVNATCHFSRNNFVRKTLIITVVPGKVLGLKKYGAGKTVKRRWWQGKAPLIQF